MLRTLYRAMVISRAKSAAYQTLAMLSDRELADIGYSRASFVDAISQISLQKWMQSMQPQHHL